MYIKDVERKSITLTNVLRYRNTVKSSDDMLREINDYLLFNHIARSDAYVTVEYGRSMADKELLDIEILVPINGSVSDVTDERFDFLPTVTFTDVVSVYFRGSIRLYKNCMGKLSAYLKANNLKPCSTIRMRYYRDKDNIYEYHDIAVEMFIEVEESRIPRDPAEKLSSAEKQVFYDRAVTILERKLSTVECCESIYSLSLVDIDNGIVSLAAENELVMNITRTKYKDIIEDAFREVMNVNSVALYLTLEDDGEEDEE